jgi:hypothetical protein
MLSYIKVKKLLTVVLISFFALVPIILSAESLEKISIIKLQVYLSSAGFNVGKLDGLYGKKTDQALTHLLKGQGLNWDGTLDSKDIEAIKTSVKKSGFIYEPNEKNRFMFDMQEQLVIAGYLQQSFTGLFDKNTKAAVTAFISDVNNYGQKFLRDGLPTYSLLQVLEKFNRDAKSKQQAFINGKLNKPSVSNSSKKLASKPKRSNIKPINLNIITKKSFNRVWVACEGTANGDIKSSKGKVYVNPGPYRTIYNLQNDAATLFKLDQNSFNNCGSKITNRVSKQWAKSKARAELDFLGVKARKGYTYVFDAEFLYDRKTTSKTVESKVNDRTSIFQLKADPNPKCGPIVGLTIHGWKGKASLQVTSTYIEIDENFSYALNSGGKITCHNLVQKFLPISFSEKKNHKLRIEVSVLDYNHYEIYVFINETHVSKINYNYKLFPHKVHTAKGFYLPFGLYQMPNEFRSLGQYNITAKYQNVGFYEVKTPKR